MALFASFSEPGFWLVMAALAGIVLLAARATVASPARDWLAPLYWLLIPYAAMLAGAVSPRLMGVYWIDWRTTFQVGAPLLLTLGLLAVVAWLFSGPRVGSAAPVGWFQRLLWVASAGAEEWFWCFLRAALWEMALALPQFSAAPLYWSVWGAALLAAPLAMALQPDGPRRLLKLAILVVTTVVFLFTRNFWLCWLVHAALAVLFTPSILHARQSRTESRPEPRPEPRT
jgi:hypothetical protein